METPHDDSFLAKLLAKEAMTRKIAAETGANTSAATQEVQRQIGQVTKKGNPITGEGVTKSGGDD